MQPIIIDVESYWDQALSLRKMSTTEYNCDPRTRPYNISITELGSGVVDVGWFDDVNNLLDKYDYENRVAFDYNGRFDFQNLGLHLNRKPKSGICLLDLIYYRYPLASKRIPLKKIADSFGWPTKIEGDGSAAKLGGVHPYEIFRKYRESAEDYVRHDAVLAANLLEHLLYEHETPVPPAQWFTMHWAMQQFISPIIELDIPVLRDEYRDVAARRQQVLQRVGVPIGDLRSDVKFKAILERHGVTVPMKASPTTGKRIPEFAKTDPFMMAGMLRSDIIGDLCTARVECNSSVNLTRAKSYLDVATCNKGKFPLHVVPSGAKTHRATGGKGGGGNPLNLPSGSAMRRSLIAPRGYVFIGFDFSKFELGIARWIAHDEPTKIAILNGEDPYTKFAASAYRVHPDMVTVDQRKQGKTTILAAQYQVGGQRVFDALRAQGINITMEEAQHLVQVFRYQEHPMVPRAWEICRRLLESQFSIFDIQGHGLNIPGTNLPGQGWLWPSGRVLVIREVTSTPDGIAAHSGRPIEPYPDKLYGGKLYQRFCQSVANEIIQEKKQDLTEAGIRVCHEVYDELLMCVRQRDNYDDLLEEIEHIATKPVDWWSGAPPLRIGDICVGTNYGDIH